MPPTQKALTQRWRRRLLRLLPSFTRGVCRSYTMFCISGNVELDRTRRNALHLRGSSWRTVREKPHTPSGSWEQRCSQHQQSSPYLLGALAVCRVSVHQGLPGAGMGTATQGQQHWGGGGPQEGAPKRPAHRVHGSCWAQRTASCSLQENVQPKCLPPLQPRSGELQQHRSAARPFLSHLCLQVFEPNSSTSRRHQESPPHHQNNQAMKAQLHSAAIYLQLRSCIPPSALSCVFLHYFSPQ